MTDKRYKNHYNMNNNDYQYTIKYIMIKLLIKKIRPYWQTVSTLIVSFYR